MVEWSRASISKPFIHAQGRGFESRSSQNLFIYVFIYLTQKQRQIGADVESYAEQIQCVKDSCFTYESSQNIFTSKYRDKNKHQINITN